MELQRRLAARVLKCGSGRVRFDESKLDEIKKAITAFDIRRLANQGVIRKVQAQGVSRARAKKRTAQRRKGRQSGHGSRKGASGARQKPKRTWVLGVRAQRALLQTLREGALISKETFKDLYRKVKGGYFRSRNHIKIYLRDHKLITRK